MQENISQKSYLNQDKKKPEDDDDDDKIKIKREKKRADKKQCT